MTTADAGAVVGMGLIVGAIVAGRVRSYGWAWLYYRRAREGRLEVGLNAAGVALARLTGLVLPLRFWTDFGTNEKLVVRSGWVQVFGDCYAPAEGSAITVMGADPPLPPPRLELRGNIFGRLAHAGDRPESPRSQAVRVEP